jgi:hypothetical protein
MQARIDDYDRKLAQMDNFQATAASQRTSFLQKIRHKGTDRKLEDERSIIMNNRQQYINLCRQKCYGTSQKEMWGMDRWPLLCAARGWSDGQGGASISLIIN